MTAKLDYTLEIEREGAVDAKQTGKKLHTPSCME